jgi:hypothetical protein
MKAVFIHRMGPDFASFRYRAQIPAQAIGASVNGGEGQVFIFSKPTPDDLILAKECKADGVKVVADLGDDHFRHATWGPIYVEMATLCDALVVPTENMAGRIMKYIGRKADAVIPDPYEEALTAPHANGHKPKYLWYGNASNLKDLDAYWAFLKDMPLTIVTGLNPRKNFDYLRWTPQVQTDQLHAANIVVLPIRTGVEYKSPNRLVNALRAGCFVSASDHPSCKEFRRYIWTGNVMTGVKWAQHFHDELNDMVADGQAYCEKFSPENVGKQWTHLLSSLCA